MKRGLILPRNTIDELCEHVSSYGRRGLETGALLMCEPNSDIVATLALAGEAGVTRRCDLFILSLPVIDRAFTYAENRGLQVRAHLHSHADGAFLSHTDKQGNLNMAGFIAAVIPNFEDPPHDPSLWGWWTYRAGGWASSEPPAVDTALAGTVILVDAVGSDDH